MNHGNNDNTKNSSIIYMMEEMREKYLINNKKIIIIFSTNEIQEIKLDQDFVSGSGFGIKKFNCQFKSWTTFGFKM